MRWSRRPTIAASLAAALACAVTTVGLIAGGAAPAGAHATLVGTAPAADEVIDAVPEVVELRFDEPVDTVEGAVQVVGPDGDRVDLGTVESLDGGATLRVPVDTEASDQGTYTVAWRVTSEDSHTITGSFVFHNGTQTGAADLDDGGGDTATDVAGGIGRWLAFAGTLAAVGAAALALLVPRSSRAGPSGGGTAAGPGDGDGLGGPPAAGEVGDGAGPPGDGPSDLAGAGTATLTATQAGAPAAPAVAPEGHVAAAGRAAAVARLRTLAVAGALVGAAGAFLAFVATVAETTGRNVYDAVGLVPDVATDTRTSQLAVARVALGLAAAAAAAVPALWRRTPVPALAASGAALVTWSLAGHAWTAPDRWVAVASDVVHVGAVAVWIGGVLALLAALPLLGDGDDDRGGDRVRVAGRFSGLALAAAGAVAVSGTVSGWQQVRSFDGLVDTGYGRLLLAKVAGFGVLVVLGWANRYRLVPLVARAVGPLRRSLRVELLVAATVLAVTAALIHQPPARSDTASGPYDASVTVEGGEVATATVDPATPGTNDIHLYFYAADGTEPLAVDAVQVTASTTDVPSRRLQVTPVTTNHVIVAGASLPSAGTWTVEVTAVVAGEPLLFTFEVPIA